jgi:hypothetical protein
MILLINDFAYKINKNKYVMSHLINIISKVITIIVIISNFKNKIKKFKLTINYFFHNFLPGRDGMFRRRAASRNGDLSTFSIKSRVVVGVQDEDGIPSFCSLFDVGQLRSDIEAVVDDQLSKIKKKRFCQKNFRFCCKLNDSLCKIERS